MNRILRRRAGASRGVRSTLIGVRRICYHSRAAANGRIEIAFTPFGSRPISRRLCSASHTSNKYLDQPRISIRASGTSLQRVGRPEIRCMARPALETHDDRGREGGGGGRGALGGRASRAAHLERLADQRLTLQFEPVWLVVSGFSTWPGLSAYGRFYERILAPARRRSGWSRHCGPTWSATWASTFRARRWWWSCGRAWWFRSVAGVDGGDRDVLRDTGDDGGGRPDRGGRVREAAGSRSGRVHAAGAGGRSSCPCTGCRARWAGPGTGVSGTGRCRRCSAGWPGWSACRSPAWAPRRCPAHGRGCWSRGCSGRRPAGSCWA